MNIRKRLTPFTLNKYMIILSAILFIGGLITIGRYTLTDRGNKKIISLRQNEEITTFLTQELSTYLDEDQLITLSSTDGLTSTPEIIDFIDQTQDPEFTAKVDTTISCNYFFNNGQEGLVLTQQALCIKDESRQETITRQQFFQARADIDIDIEDINGVLSNTAPDDSQNDITNTPYQSLPLLLTQDPLYINQDLLQLIGEDLAKLQKDEAVQEMISE